MARTPYASLSDRLDAMDSHLELLRQDLEALRREMTGK